MVRSLRFVKMSEEVEDIKRVLAICFRDGSVQSSDDVERILSFDMGWMDTETAHNAIKGLTFAGWIIDKDGELSPNCEIRGVKAPLGWQPRPSRLTDPIVNSGSKQDGTKDVQKEHIILPTEEKTEIESADPRERIEKRLIRYISKQSGIEIDEIKRRAERKIAALRYCKMWLALCLISREQDLEMNSIIDSFAN